MTDRPKIQVVVADVDGTLVTPEKLLTERAIAAVRSLAHAGIGFVVTSGRPPRGMRMLVEPLRLTLPIAGFNGGMIVRPDMTPVAFKAIDPELVVPIIRTLIEGGLDAWVYQGNDWLVRDARAPYVSREQSTIQFSPIVTNDLERHIDQVVKIVGVNDDNAIMTPCERLIQQRFGTRVTSLRSRPRYLDITHPDANKGEVVRQLARYLGIPCEAVATVGDMSNDVLMFAASGLSIAMGQADTDVKRVADRITASNTEDGFAEAIERFVLHRE